MSTPPTVRQLRPQVQAADLGALLRFAYVPISPAFVRGKAMHADVRCSELSKAFTSHHSTERHFASADRPDRPRSLSFAL